MGAVLVPFAIVVACSSSGTGSTSSMAMTNGTASGTTTAGSTTSASGSTSASNTTSATGTTTSGGVTGSTSAGSTTASTTSGTTAGTTGAMSTMNCDSSLAKSGAACDGPCNTQCGYQKLGTKMCTCSGTPAAPGTYTDCPCPKPAAYMGMDSNADGTPDGVYCDALPAPGAGFPTSADGMTASLKDMPCPTEWLQCIGKDANTGTPAGCVCMTDPTTTPPSLVWQCGSTNKWFVLTGSDPNCTSSTAKTGNACTMDCPIGCGFNASGTKLCTCAGGVYTACPCAPPATWAGAATAPYCDALTSDGLGMTAMLKGKACTTVNDECVGRDPNTGTPQGCACLNDPSTMTLLWACGSTNKWFAAQ